MQQVLNAKERRKAFWKFFIFFLLTILAVIGAVFFNFQMPRAENKILRQEMAGYGQSAGDRSKFSEVLLQVKNKLDSLDKVDESAKAGLDGNIGRLIDDLKKMSANDETNNTIIAGFEGYRFYKNKSMAATKGDNALETCQEKLQTARDEINDLKTKMTNCGCR